MHMFNVIVKPRVCKTLKTVKNRKIKQSLLDALFELRDFGLKATQVKVLVSHE